MNAIRWTAAQVRQLTDLELVDQALVVAGENNESDCREPLAILRAELLRRLAAGRVQRPGVP